MPLSISVALGTYNSARFIGEQVHSILAQHRLPAEIVVSDDGSSDDTLDIIRDIIDESPTDVALRILPGAARAGVTGNFERAVAACASDLIALCDHDDIWHTDRLERMAVPFEQDPSLLLQHSDARLVDGSGKPLGYSLFDALALTPAERAAAGTGRPFGAYIRRNLVTGATVLFRRTLLEAALPFPREWVHDEWLAIVAASTGRVQLLDAQLTDYRIHGSNQIGVTRPTVSGRLRRVLEPRGDRLVDLARRSDLLVERLERIDADPAARALARQKAVFERYRASYPRLRVARFGPVIRRYRSGEYARLSSQGVLDVVRDLVQPA